MRRFDPERKTVELYTDGSWKDKLKEVMASFNWNDSEMMHLIKLYQYLDLQHIQN